MSLSDPTFIGQVASVTGGIVRVRLREDMPTTLVMIEGESYRVGQIGAFFRIALGYTQLSAVCTQVGADAAPSNSLEADSGSALETPTTERLAGYRCMAVTLFGESIGSQFERGVGQYPTVGDEVHIVTNEDLQVIYGWSRNKGGTVPGWHNCRGVWDFRRSQRRGTCQSALRHCWIDGSWKIEPCNHSS
jgi:hypothetical protein